MDPSHEIPMLLKKINDRMFAKANADMSASNLTFSQMYVLVHLTKADGRMVSLKELEKSFHVAQPTMAGIVSRLAAKGFVRTEPKPGDRRAKIVCLTSKGEAFMKQHREDMDRNDAKLFRRMSLAERQELYRLLNILWEEVQDDTKGLEIMRPSQKETMKGEPENA
ncbi:MAG: MarR family winged helix-turn-helix transcriptional regulator [Lachnospiraceae bacterium]|jgi:DNA-binding MarR family transcriptional regulator